MQADRSYTNDDEVLASEDEGYEPSSVRQEGSEEEGEDLMDNMEAWVCLKIGLRIFWGKSVSAAIYNDVLRFYMSYNLFWLFFLACKWSVIRRYE